MRVPCIQTRATTTTDAAATVAAAADSEWGGGFRGRAGVAVLAAANVAGVAMWHSEALAELKRRREEAARRRIELLKSSDMHVRRGSTCSWPCLASKTARVCRSSSITSETEVFVTSDTDGPYVCVATADFSLAASCPSCSTKAALRTTGLSITLMCYIALNRNALQYNTYQLDCHSVGV